MASTSLLAAGMSASSLLRISSIAKWITSLRKRAHNHATEADGEKIAVLREGRARLNLLQAVAHRRPLAAQKQLQQ
jgi:hypothetical protein